MKTLVRGAPWFTAVNTAAEQGATGAHEAIAAHARANAIAMTA